MKIKQKDNVFTLTPSKKDIKTEKAKIKKQLERMSRQHKKDNKAFNITSVCRADMQSIGFDTSKLTDSDMKKIASRLADAYCHSTFWQDVESILVDVYELEQHDM